MLMMKLMAPGKSLATPATTMFRQPHQAVFLTQPSYFNFASRMAQKRIYVEKSKVKIPKTDETLAFRKPWDSKTRLMNVKVATVTKRATFTR